MFSFCPHCGKSIGQEQIEGRLLVCKHCTREIGLVASGKGVMVNQADEIIRGGHAAPCPLCGQLVQVKASGTGKTFVPHYVTSPQRRICPGSGKQLVPASSPVKNKPAGKDLSAFMTREVFRIVSCGSSTGPVIEELTLEYLDKSERVRTQIEGLRAILGPDFRMKDYPAGLKQPDLAVWGNCSGCVVAKKDPRGGFQQLTSGEIILVMEQIKQDKQLFFQ
jgi:hypothetical protein